MAHITGGGLTENIPRILRKGLVAEINLSSWKFPRAFKMAYKKKEKFLKQTCLKYLIVELVWFA